MNKAVCWILGILSGSVLTVGAEALIIAATPSKNYLNAFGTQLVGDNIGNKGLFDVLTNIPNFTVDDLPIIKQALDELAADPNFAGLVEIDYEQIRNVKLTDAHLSSAFRSAFKIVATLSTLDVDLGDFGQLNMFSSWQEVSPSNDEISANPYVFYYKQADGTYARAFDEHGHAVSGYSSGQLYLANLSEITVTDLFVNLSYQVKELTFKEFMVNMMGVKETDLENNAIYKIVGNKKLSELSNMELNDILLSNVIGIEDNEKLYAVLSDCLDGKAKEEITLGDLSGMDFDKVKLSSIIAYEGNQSLYDILMDLCEYDGSDGKTYADLAIGDLSGLDASQLHLSTVLSSNSSNTIINHLVEKGSTIGSLSNDINAMSTFELFGDKVFTDSSNAADWANEDVYYLDDASSSYIDTPIGGAAVYHIDVDAGIWLIFAYDSSEYDVNGKAKNFAPSDITFSKMQDEPKSLSNKMADAKIYQLITAGIIEEDPASPISDMIKAQTFGEVLASLS